jgi:mannose-6-phosphate isomerase-like protein (cupin superfamily)
MFIENIKNIAKENRYFREVLYTGPHSQLVVMSIPSGEDIGEETHQNLDQMLYIVDGNGEAQLNGEVKPFSKGDAIFVPAGVKHNIINQSEDRLQLYTVYSPPAHPDGTLHKTKTDAQKEEQKI